MNKIFVILILSAMVTTGHLKTMCKRCWNLDSIECGTEKEAECDGPKCMMVSEYFNISNVIYNSVKKTCGTDMMCDNCFSLSTNHGLRLRISGQCSEGDNSNADMEYKELCHDKMPLNSLMCPSCYVNTSTDGCISDGMVLCRGKEFECLKFRSTIQLSDGKKIPMSLQGCSTEGSCKIGVGIVLGARQLDTMELACTPAIPVNLAGNTKSSHLVRTLMQV